MKKSILVSMLFAGLMSQPSLAQSQGDRVLNVQHVSSRYLLEAHMLKISPETIVINNPDGSVTLDSIRISVPGATNGSGGGESFQVARSAFREHLEIPVCKILNMVVKDDRSIEYAYTEDQKPTRMARLRVDGTFMGVQSTVERLKMVVCKPQ